MVEVSIIVPNYNHLSFLKERLESIFNQSFQDYEIILLDDCSTDGSRQVLEQFSGHPKVSHYIANVTNSGSTFLQWEKGISLASGRFIWFAESDDMADVDFLQNLVPILRSRPGVGIVFCQSEIINNRSEVLHNNLRWTNSLDSALFLNDFEMKGIEAVGRFFVLRNIIPNASACLFRRELFFDAKLEAGKFRYCGDWMLWVSILIKSDLFYVSRPLNLFRQHAAVTRIRKGFKRNEQYFLEVLAIRTAILAAIDLDPKIRSEVRRYTGQTLSRAFSFRSLFFTFEGRKLLKKFRALDPWIDLRLQYFVFRKKFARLLK
jgi:glycosyltransferase involved in cell wall biosynthesis